MSKVTLVTGGARSGKSTFAEELAAAKGDKILYVATAKAIDEEMKDFSVVVAQAAGTGGNMIRIIRDTAEKIVSGIELKEELSTMIAARQLEQKIMTFMPAGIILLLRLSSPGFMDMLYGSPMGIAVMSAAVGLNILADYIGKRIVGRLETE